MRAKCIFTTHTPVPAGHDQFPLELVEKMGDNFKYVVDMQDMFAVDVQKHIFQYGDDFARVPELAQRGLRLNMTYLALNLSNYVNGVAKKHGEVSRLMFADYPVDAITNGVHAATWTTEPFQALFDRHIPGWREDNFSLRYVLNIPDARAVGGAPAGQAGAAGLRQPRDQRRHGQDVLTLGFARRVATYKRADLLFSDLERLRRISREVGPIQVIFAGKAHPRDSQGKDLIRRIFQAAEALKPDIKVAYLANYDTWLARLLTGGVDVWLNTPQPPNEASGTSGMKAALNGVPSFSILDGWWLEGHIENFTGWSIGAPVIHGSEGDDCSGDADCLYGKLEKVIVPRYYQDRHGLHAGHVRGHRHQRLLFQHPAHGAAVRGEGVPLRIRRGPLRLNHGRRWTAPSSCLGAVELAAPKKFYSKFPSAVLACFNPGFCNYPPSKKPPL